MKDQNTESLFGKEFVALNTVFFLACVTMAVFFKFHSYLASLGIHPRWFGPIIASDSIAGLVFQPFLSVFFTAVNARRWMFIGICTMIAAFLFYNLTSTVAGLIAVRILHGAGFAVLVSAMTALFVYYIPSQKSGQAFGIVSTIRLLPYAFVPPLMGLFGETSQGFTGVLRYCILLMGTAVFTICLLKPPSPSFGIPSGHGGGINLREFMEDLTDRKVFALMVINLLLYSGYTTVFFFFAEYGKSVGIDNPGLFFTVATLTMIGVRLLGGTFFDKVNKTTLTALFLADLTVCYPLLRFIDYSVLFYVLSLLVGLGWGVVMPVLSALMFDVSAPRFRAFNLNFSLVMMQGGFFLGPIMGGQVLEYFGYGGLFSFCSATSLLAFCVTFIAKEKQIRP